MIPLDGYDITAAFKAIEDELISSMIRNMKRHRAEETEQGFKWSMWQAEQLKSLEKYKRENQKKYKKQFNSINREIEELIWQARQTGNMQQEIRILQAIRKGFKVRGKNKSPAHQAMTAEFFRLNDKKLEALIEATTHNMEKAETAVLRMANDQYRKVIFNAQVYANTGAGTYEKAVDMATHDFLSAGLNCVVYANGARHTLSDYADMAIRTASKRAYLTGEGEKRQEWGIHTVIVNKRGNPCPKCLPFCGKILIDDVWSGGSRKDGNYPLMSKAIEHGLYHPRCKDSHTTYFPGISTADDTWTQEELDAIGQNYEKEQKLQNAGLQEERYGRLAEYSLDEENQKRYAARREEWRKRQEQIQKDKQPEVSNEIVFDDAMKGEGWEESRDIILKLAGQYRTSLRKVYAGAKNAAGTMDMGGNLRLSSKDISAAMHEFAHSISIEEMTKFKAVDDSAFWKEIRKIRTKYRRDVGDDVNRWISSYEHSSGNVNEFFAEAFTQAKMKELGFYIPEKYGKDFTYSQQVLDTVDRYFGKSAEGLKAGVKDIANYSGSGIITSGARIIDPDSDAGMKFAKMYYKEIQSFSTDSKKIAKNLGKSEKEIQKVKEYLFDTGFDPDCAIAQSWQRLMEGKDIKPHDRTLIEHELLEMQIKREHPELEHWKAHELATKRYDYQKETGEYYGNLEKHKKNK